MSFKVFFFFILELLQIVAIAAIVVVPIRYFVFQPFLVKGASMESSFHDGDYLIIDELSYRLREPQRGEVVVFHYPFDPSQRFIKRVIGLPGEAISIKDSRVIITNSGGERAVLDETYLGDGIITTPDMPEILLKQDEYFVLGDNRPHSFDSRKWGEVASKYIIGRVIIRAWPPDTLETYFSEVSY